MATSSPSPSQNTPPSAWESLPSQLTAAVELPAWRWEGLIQADDLSLSRFPGGDVSQATRALSALLPVGTKLLVELVLHSELGVELKVKASLAAYACLTAVLNKEGYHVSPISSQRPRRPY
jgi:hypothetical protein